MKIKVPVLPTGFRQSHGFSCCPCLHPLLKKVNARIRLFYLKVTLAKSLINRFSSQKRKFTNEEPQPGLELPQALKEPAHIFQLKEKRRRCMYFILRTKIQNALLSASPSVSLCIQKD